MHVGYLNSRVAHGLADRLDVRRRRMRAPQHWKNYMVVVIVDVMASSEPMGMIAHHVALWPQAV